MPPHETVDVASAQWADSLVVVLSGELEVLCHSGCRALFASGSILTFAGLSVRALHNPRSHALVLQALTREPMTT